MLGVHGIASDVGNLFHRLQNDSISKQSRVFYLECARSALSSGTPYPVRETRHSTHTCVTKMSSNGIPILENNQFKKLNIRHFIESHEMIATTTSNLRITVYIIKSG